MVFQSAEAAKSIHELFIPIKVDKNYAENDTLKRKYNLRGYPTIVIAKDNGEEIDRIVGFSGDKDEFLQTISEYANGKNTLSSFLTELEKSPENVEVQYKVAQKYDDRGEPGAATQYFKNVLKYDPNDKHGYNEGSKYMLAIYSIYLNTDFSKLEKYVDETENSEYKAKGYKRLAREYGKKGMMDKAAVAIEEALKLSPEDTSFMNEMGWFIFKSELTDYYDMGIGLAERALELKPDAAGIWDTLAWLLHANGDLNGAIEAMKKANTIAPDEKYYKDNLDKLLSEMNKTKS